MSFVSERFLRYVSYDTQSDEFSETCPSTSKQTLLGKLLVEEMLAMGFSRSTLTPVPNENDSTIYRMVGRYRATVSSDHEIFRR